MEIHVSIRLSHDAQQAGHRLQRCRSWRARPPRESTQRRSTLGRLTVGLAEPRRAVPVLLAGRTRDDIAKPDLYLLFAPAADRRTVDGLLAFFAVARQRSVPPRNSAFRNGAERGGARIGNAAGLAPHRTQRRTDGRLM
jgi:hypothetical protein